VRSGIFRIRPANSMGRKWNSTRSRPKGLTNSPRAGAPRVAIRGVVKVAIKGTIGEAIREAVRAVKGATREETTGETRGRGREDRIKVGVEVMRSVGVREGNDIFKADYTYLTRSKNNHQPV
jgi:hypothetical protein